MIEVRTFNQTGMQEQEVLFVASNNIRAVKTIRYILNQKFNLQETKRLYLNSTDRELNERLADRITVEHPNDKKTAYLIIDDVRFQFIEIDSDLGSNHVGNLKECIKIYFPDVYVAQKQFKKEEMIESLKETMEDHFEDSSENRELFDKIKLLIDQLN